MVQTQVNVQMTAPPEKRDEVLRAFRAGIRRTRIELGCVRCNLWQQVGDPNSLLFMELWDDRASIERHARSQFFGEILELVELSTEPPEISFQTITTTAGLEYLAALRGYSEPSLERAQDD